MLGGAPVMRVLDSQKQVIGIVWLAGLTSSRKGPAQLFRLEVGKVELEGVWVCRNREFNRIGDAAEEA